MKVSNWIVRKPCDIRTRYL